MAWLTSFVYDETQELYPSKKSAIPPYVILYDETMVAVRLQLPRDGTRSYGIIDAKQQPRQN